jgi:hypothetical protein
MIYFNEGVHVKQRMKYGGREVSEVFYELMIPTLLVVLVALLEFIVAKNSKMEVFLRSLIDLPKDFMLLSLGFLATFMLLDSDNVRKGLVVFILFIIVTIIAVAFRRFSIDEYDEIIAKGGNFAKTARLAVTVFCTNLGTFAFYGYTVSLFGEL